jgi:hypothetical protein
VIAVSLNGPGFFTRATEEADIRRGKGLPAAADSVVDGRFLDRFQQWDEGPVWWEASSPDAVPGTWIQIDLAGPRTIGSVTVQADNNDSYLLTYRNPSSGDWKDLWVVPPEYAFGMVTRPNQFDDGDRHVLPTPVTTDAVRIAAQEGDGMYAVSEVQLFVQE